MCNDFVSELFIEPMFYFAIDTIELIEIIQNFIGFFEEFN